MAARKSKRSRKSKRVSDSKTSGEGHVVEKPEKSRKKTCSINNLLVAVLLVSVVAVVYLYVRVYEPSNGITSSTVSGYQGAGSQEKVKVQFYVMSRCPYGTQVEDAITPVLKQLGESIDFTLNYIADDNGDGTFQSLHGQTEVDGDLIQVCAMKYYPENYGYMDLVVCQNRDSTKIPDNWVSCAQELGMDVVKLGACFSGAEGKQLLSQSIKVSDEAKATGSPTIYIGSDRYNGPRDSLSFARSICGKLSGNAYCDEMPACVSDMDCTAEPTKEGKCVNAGEENAECVYTDPAPIELIVVNSDECTNCDPSRIVSVSNQLFLGLTVRYVSYESGEGQKLTQEYGIKLLPAYLFDANITRSRSYSQVERSLVKSGDKYLIHPQAAGSSYNPNLVEVPNKLDLFVMSKCPYGTMAEQNVKPVLDLFGDQINFSLWFIGDETSPGVFRSLHGQTEVDEDMRQVCAMKHSPGEYFDYILCIAEDYTNADKIWESCAQQTGVNASAVKACFGGDEGKKLLAENMKVGNEFGVGSSPTFIVNGKVQFGGALPADAIKTNVCQSNPALDGCDVTLDTGSAGATVPSGGAC